MLRSFTCQNMALTVLHAPYLLDIGAREEFQKLNRPQQREREFFIDNLLVRIHLIIEMVSVDRPRAMGV